MPVKMDLDKNWDSKLLKSLEAGLLEMVTEIHRRAVILAPKETSALANSGKVNRKTNTEYSATFGSARVPYARRRHFENKKNPQTLGYLAKAGDGVARGDKGKYFRSKIK